jgi:hypothetical protein
VNQFVDFEGQVQHSRDEGNPLRPGSCVPESVSFDEAQNGIGNGNAGNCKHFGFGQGVGPVEEHLSKVVIGADMKEFEETVGNVLGIFPVYQQEDAKGRQQDDHALGEFQRGDGAEDLDSPAVLRFRQCDAGVHARTHYNIISLVANSIVAPG